MSFSVTYCGWIKWFVACPVVSNPSLFLVVGGDRQKDEERMMMMLPFSVCNTFLMDRINCRIVELLQPLAHSVGTRSTLKVVTFQDVCSVAVQ